MRLPPPARRVQRYRPPPAVHRLLGLDCLTVMTGRIVDPGFCALVEKGWAHRDYRAHYPNFRCNYVITPAGRRVACDLRGRKWE